MSQVVNYSVNDGIGVIAIDDDKANAMSIALMGQLNDALDQAERDKAVTLIVGRPGIFSAGFDLKEMKSGPETLVTQIRTGAELSMRLLSFPFPVVTACTGHAYPMGAFLMMSADYRFGIDGPYNIGMNEVVIGLTVPQFAVHLAKARLTPAYFSRTVISGEMFDPSKAVAAGFLDELVSPDSLMDQALAKAHTLSEVNIKAHHATKLKARGPLLEAMRTAVEAEYTIEAIREAMKMA